MKKNGFTLIEVVVSLAILGIISIAIFTVIGNNLDFLNKSKKISQNTMLAQQKIELDMSDIKAKLRDSDHGLSLSNVTIDGVNISYFKLEKNYNEGEYKVFITQQQLPEYILLKTFNVKATLKSGTNDAYNIYPISTSSIKGSHTPDSSTYSSHWMMDLKQWYVSRPGFNMPVPRGNTGATNFKFYDYLVSKGLDYEAGIRYPLFPDDYILIGTNTTDTILDVSKYAGRHIIYKVTGAAKSGRIGIPEHSEPVFISGLTQTDNLVLHLDASYIDPSNTDQVINDTKVNKWLDLSSGINKSSPTEFASQSTDNKRPILTDNPIGEDFVGRYLQFDANKEMSISAQGTNNKTIYVFTVAKGNDEALLMTNNSNTVRLSQTADEIYSGWKLVFDKFTNGSNTNFNNFTIGKDSANIAEIIVYSYSTSLSSTEESELFTSVSNYVTSKYVEFDPIGEIDKIYDINVEIVAGQNYAAPSSALAKMKYGQDKYVPIEWENGGVIDNTTPGIVTLNGNAINNSSKKVILKVTIVFVPVESITLDKTNLELLVGSAYELKATILPENATDKRLSWSSVNSNIVSVDGNGKITAKAKGNSVITVQSLDGSNKSAISNITVVTQEDVIRKELREYLDGINLSVTGATNTRPTISLPSNPSGISYSFSSNPSGGSGARITISGSTATVYRESNDKTATITITATKIGYPSFTENIIFNVSIPSSSTPRRAVTITKQ